MDENKGRAAATSELSAVLGEPKPGRMMLVHDDVSQRLDEMADLCEHWKRWREGRDYTPRAVRAALVLLSREVAALAEFEEAHGPRMEEVR